MPGEPAMVYTELEPAAELRPWVAAWWHFRVFDGVGEIGYRVPLTGGVMLSLPRGYAAGIAGPRVAPLRTTVCGGEVYWGAHLWPGAAASILGPAAGDLRGELVLAAEVVDGDWAERLERTLAEEDDEGAAGRALDAAFAELAAEAAPLDDVVMTAVMRLISAAGAVPIARLAEELGLSARQLRRRFRRAVELTPREFVRARRTCSPAVAAAGERVCWVDVAAEHGYSDAARLVREYRRLSRR